jgi:glutamate-1-semialdehyde aminotransferase
LHSQKIVKPSKSWRQKLDEMGKKYGKILIFSDGKNGRKIKNPGISAF